MADKQSIIVFDLSKKEKGNPSRHFKKIVKHLKPTHKCVINKDPLSLNKLKSVKLLIFAQPTLPFARDELAVLDEYLQGGGTVLIMGEDGGEASNLNEFLANYGITMNCNSVVRTNYYKYFHPKEAFITNGVLHEAFVSLANDEDYKENPQFGSLIDYDQEDIRELNITGFDFVYPFGCSLTLQEAMPLLTSGSVSYPYNECLLAVSHANGGALFVTGSWKILSDPYFEKEENMKLITFMLNYAGNKRNWKPNPDIAQTSEFKKRRIAPEHRSALGETQVRDTGDPRNLGELLRTLPAKPFLDILPTSTRSAGALPVTQHHIRGADADPADLRDADARPDSGGLPANSGGA